MTKLIVLKVLKKEYKKLTLEVDSIGYHVIYFEFNQALGGTTFPTPEEAVQYFEEIQEQL